MKNRWRILGAMITLTLVLSACGTTASEDKEPKTTENTPDVEVDESEAENVDKSDDVVIEEPVEEDVAVTEKTEEKSTSNEPATETKTDFSKGATLVNSEEQAFSMYVLPSYKLTSEEPGRDSLYSETDDAVFMRVETLPNEEGTYDYLAENMLAVLDASSNGDTPVELSDVDSLPSGDGITNVKAYSVKAETGPVTAILFERGDIIVRLTIFDSAEAKHYKQLLQMGETVTSN